MSWSRNMATLRMTIMSKPMDKNAKIYIAGHHGMVGSAIARRLAAAGYTNIVTRTHAELDLTDQTAVTQVLEYEKPDYIFLAAAKVGGIHANNTYRAEFIYQNLMMEANIVHAAWQAGVQRLLFLGSSCIYPRDCPQPIKEDYLLTGPLEQTNEPYAVAKIAGIKLCESYNRQYGTQYFATMPTNLYGPGDNYHRQDSHVLPALIRRLGTGTCAISKTVPNTLRWTTGGPSAGATRVAANRLEVGSKLIALTETEFSTSVGRSNSRSPPSSGAGPGSSTST